MVLLIMVYTLYFIPLYFWVLDQFDLINSYKTLLEIELKKYTST